MCVHGIPIATLWVWPISLELATTTINQLVMPSQHIAVKCAGIMPTPIVWESALTPTVPTDHMTLAEIPIHTKYQANRELDSRLQFLHCPPYMQDTAVPTVTNFTTKSLKLVWP